MTLYADANAILKLYLVEADSEEAEAILSSDPVWITGFHSLVEVRRNLARLLEGVDLEDAQQQFAVDWEATEAVELDRRVCERAADLAERTGVRSLDALHLGAAEVAGAADGTPLVTFDRRLAGAARSLGWNVLPG
ncbi:MAG: type II toxin-antitoxin system VapC family toxin [Gaiellaceae bacterium]